MPILVLAFATATLGIGVFLLLTALYPRRTGVTRYCRKCRYNLTGLASTVCPECGADIQAPTAILTGDRTIRRARLAAGITLTILAAAIGTTFAIGYARGIDWYIYRPT